MEGKWHYLNQKHRHLPQILMYLNHLAVVQLLAESIPCHIQPGGLHFRDLWH